MAVFNVAGYLIEERRRWSAITASHEDNIPNKFRILKERHIQMKKTYRFQLSKNQTSSSCLVGPKNHPTIVSRSGIDLTTSRPPASIASSWPRCRMPIITRPKWLADSRLLVYLFLFALITFIHKINTVWLFSVDPSGYFVTLLVLPFEKSQST